MDMERENGAKEDAFFGGNTSTFGCLLNFGIIAMSFTCILIWLDVFRLFQEL